MSYTESGAYKYYKNEQERRANRNVAIADIPIPEDLPAAYDVDDAIAEDEFAVFKHQELQKWYIDEINVGGSGVSHDFYIALIIGWSTENYQKTLENEFGAKMYEKSMYFDNEDAAVKAMSWVVAMKTMSVMTGEDVIDPWDNKFGFWRG